MPECRLHVSKRTVQFWIEFLFKKKTFENLLRFESEENSKIYTNNFPL